MRLPGDCICVLSKEEIHIAMKTFDNTQTIKTELNFSVWYLKMFFSMHFLFDISKFKNSKVSTWLCILNSWFLFSQHDWYIKYILNPFFCFHYMTDELNVFSIPVFCFLNMTDVLNIFSIPDFCFLNMTDISNIF